MADFRQFKLQINGVEKNVLAEVVDQKFWCLVDGETHCFDIADLSGSSSSRRSKGKVKSANHITAPMPGKVTKVFVTEGDSVQKGQALLVMEAMKMEYTLKSDLDTAVEKINCKVGDQVVLGHLLVQLKPSKESAQ